ncbi:hypothetical protein EXIGLDRAFT_834393 [Exidia glandulosa HHB12029]|uniref:Uncharacterized protein n=1 Tax=Exidia glandulosa HHB12029 TaxID=1314781 RepID=A0A165JRC9_EXIGL|nr:hypothetical protein EXIGLDRAFT_834393 [Exidia glandulosa HHB12029]
MPGTDSEPVARDLAVQEARTDAHSTAAAGIELSGSDTAPWAAAPWEDMVENCKARTNKEPRDFQLKVGENAAWKGVDTLLKAPTNAGKTLAQLVLVRLGPQALSSSSPALLSSSPARPFTQPERAQGSSLGNGKPKTGP